MVDKTIILKLKEKYPNYINLDYTYCPLYIAVENNDIEIAKHLIDEHKKNFISSNILQYNVYKNWYYPKVTLLLHIGVEKRYIEMLEFLLLNDISQEFRDSNGDTALSKSISIGYKEAEKLLSKYNKDPDNEINPFFHIIKHISRTTGAVCKNIKDNLSNKSVCFIFEYTDSLPNKFLQTKKIETKISEINNKLEINIILNITRSCDENSSVTFELSLDDAKKTNKKLESGILGAAEGLTEIIQGLNNKYIGSELAKYLDPITETARLRQICKSVENSFKEKIKKSRDYLNKSNYIR